MKKRITALPQTCYAFFLHLSLCLMLVDWACPIPPFIGWFGVYEGSLLLLGVCFLICFVRDKGRFLGRFWHILTASKWIGALLALYVALGAVTVLYGPDPAFGSVRYVTVVQMMVYMVFLLYYLFPGKEWADSLPRLRLVALTVGLSAALIAMIALLGYFVTGYTAYFQRISTIRDYNQYATILLMGLICFTFYAIHAPWKTARRYACLIPYWVLLSTAIYQAGSRRSDVLLCLLAGCSLMYALYQEIRRHQRNRNGRRLAACVCLLAVCAGLCVTCASLVHTAVGTLGQRRLQDAEELLETLPPEEVDSAALDRLALAGRQDELTAALEGIVDGSGFARRKMIWNVALDKILHSDAVHLLFGYGASYSWELYDDFDNPLVAELRRLYPKSLSRTQWLNPHQLFLQDMLEGGLLLLLCQLALLASVGLALLRLVRSTPHTALPMLLLWMVLMVTLLISSARGMVAHKFFWLLMTVLLAERARIQAAKDKVMA